MESLLPIEPTNAPLEDFDKIPFDLSPDKSRGKLVITSHGEKGAGKTYGVFLITTGRLGGFPAGKTVAISFDNKTKITYEQHFTYDDITVYDGKRYYREDPAQCTKSGMMSYKYIQRLLESYKANQPDWIVFDGFTVMSLIFEMAMRYKHGLQPSQGVANFNVWKDRARYLQDIHNLACKVAKYGVVYITYSEKDEIVESGTTVSKTDVPKYIDVIMQETDVVLHATKAKGKEGDLFFLRVESTKFKTYLDMDGKPIPLCDTTLEQGRTFNISKLANIAPKKYVPAPNAVEKKVETPITQQVKEVSKTPEVPKQSVIATLILPEKQIEVPKPIETPKVIESPKLQEQPKIETKKWEVPDLLMI